MVSAALHSSARDDWQTPDEIWQLVYLLDYPWDPCPTGGTDGLTAPFARDQLNYVNPPYGRAIVKWTAKCCDEGDRGCEIIMLCPGRIDTRWYQDTKRHARALCEWTGRITFRGAQDPAPFPSAFFYWGPRPYLFAYVFSQRGLVEVMR